MPVYFSDKGLVIDFTEEVKNAGDAPYRVTEEMLAPLLDQARAGKKPIVKCECAGVEIVFAVNFSELEFNAEANFRGAIFRKGANFEGARFYGDVRFDDAVFDGETGKRYDKDFDINFKGVRIGREYQLKFGEWWILFSLEYNGFFQIFRRNRKGWEREYFTEVNELIKILDDWGFDKDALNKILDSFKIFKKNSQTMSFRNCRIGVNIQEVDFSKSTFSGKVVNFSCASFSNSGSVHFNRAKFSNNGGVAFDDVCFSSNHNTDYQANVDFDGVLFVNGGTVSFQETKFLNNGEVNFNWVKFSNCGNAYFLSTRFSNNGAVKFEFVEFQNNDHVIFGGSIFSNSGHVQFEWVKFSNGGPINFGEVRFLNHQAVIFRDIHLNNSDDIYLKGILFANQSSLIFTLCNIFEKQALVFYECLFLCSGIVDFGKSVFPDKGSLWFQRCHFANANKIDFTGCMFRQAIFEGGSVSWPDKFDFRKRLRQEKFNDNECDKKKFLMQEVLGDVKLPDWLSNTTVPCHTPVFDDNVGEVLFKDLTVESAKNLLFRLVNLGNATFDGVTLKHIELNAPTWGTEDRKTIGELWKECGERDGITQWNDAGLRWIFCGKLFLCELLNLYKTDNFPLFVSSKRSVLKIEKDLRSGKAGVMPKDVENQYTQLKSNLEKYGDYVNAGDFHYGEMEMRRMGMSPGERRSIYGWFLRFYKWTSGYGERPWKALAGLVLMIAFFSFGACFLGHFVECPHDPNLDMFCDASHNPKGIYAKLFISTGLVLSPFWKEISHFSDITDANAIFYTYIFFAKLIIYIQLVMFIMALRRRFKR